MVEMCNFDDAKQFMLIHHFNIPAKEKNNTENSGFLHEIITHNKYRFLNSFL